MNSISLNLPLSSDNWRLFESSVDGKTWNQLKVTKNEDDMESAIVSPDIRYVRMMNNSPKNRHSF